jgi:hypothetical protein
MLAPMDCRYSVESSGCSGINSGLAHSSSLAVAGIGSGNMFGCSDGCTKALSLPLRAPRFGLL